MTRISYRRKRNSERIRLAPEIQDSEPVKAKLEQITAEPFYDSCSSDQGNHQEPPHPQGKEFFQRSAWSTSAVIAAIRSGFDFFVQRAILKDFAICRNLVGL
jgi:hypothetical protein